MIYFNFILSFANVELSRSVTDPSAADRIAREKGRPQDPHLFQRKLRRPAHPLERVSVCSRSEPRGST